MMKKPVFILLMFFASWFTADGQVTNVSVERYYVTDINDATDTLGNFPLDPGTVTYRVFVELKPGSRLKAIYGDANHPLKIQSSQPFYNNIDRPNAFFGYQMNKNWFDDNATIALDSWLTIGLGAFQSATAFMGVLKTDDNDGSFIGGSNNTGGTAQIGGGILNNNDPTATPVISTADGLVSSTISPGQWLDLGFKDISGADTTVFGVNQLGADFINHACRLQQNNAVSATLGNKVLVAQLTTKGDISFKLNVDVEEPATNGSVVVKYVADNSNIQPGEILSPFLTYPPICGCRDPEYLEYNPIYACNIQDSCQTLIRFGCMDTTACNYDPDANFNLQSLCCYPGYCNDRDLSIVCPGLANGRIGIISAYPNPANSQVSIDWRLEDSDEGAYMSLCDMYGKLLRTIPLSGKVGSTMVPLENLTAGMYMIHLKSHQSVHSTQVFIR